MKKFILLTVAALMLIAALTSCNDSREIPVSNGTEFYFVDVSSRCVYAYVELGSGKYSTAGFFTVYAEDGTPLRYEGELPTVDGQFINVSSEQLGLLPASIVAVH